MCRISAVGAITALVMTAAVGWTAPPMPAPKSDPAAKSPAPTPTRQDVAKSLEQEQKIYLDRLQFCTKLRQIASETSDEKLLAKADALEQQATELYLKKTAPLKTLVEDIKAAEAHLEERRNNPVPPKGTASTGGRVTGRAPNGRPIIAKE